MVKTPLPKSIYINCARLLLLLLLRGLSELLLLLLIAIFTIGQLWHTECTPFDCRLRESGELKDTMIDDLNTKLSSTSREKQKLASDLDQVVGEQSRFRSLEQENRTLNQTLMADKKALAKLRKDLVDEKMRFESVTAKLEALQNQLQMIGIDPEAFDGAEELLSQERAHNMQGAMAQLLEGREKKLERQEIQLTALKNKNQELVQELECLRIKVQAGDAKSSLESQLRPVILEREQLKEELVKIKIDMDSSAKKVRQH